MFLNFFDQLRRGGIRVSLHEWLTLTEAMARGMVPPNLTQFYYASRSILVKRESDFDRFDQVFMEVFRGVEADTSVIDDVLKWLDDPKGMPQLTPEEMAAIESMDLEALRKLFEERLAEQTERHDGGNRWVGTGGTSPFGHGGYHPGGVRVGGSGGGRSAMQIATRRAFQNYRDDIILDVRQMKVALRKLRRLSRRGGTEELDLDETVDQTCLNAGDLTLAFRPPRKNQVRLVLLMDAGGSMVPYARLVSRLFTAASKSGHWKSFSSYYFHNCVYETVWHDITMRDDSEHPTSKLIADATESSVLIVVGDATMHPGELTERHGSIDYWHRNETAGIEWLRRLENAFPTSAWLNPMPDRWWNAPSLILVGRHFSMFPLTLSGLDDAVSHLRTSRQS
jgi:uncharacterized protein with von Willebrand factor type A (vWA) domain